MAAGIDIDRYLAIVWVMMAAICVVAGTLWAIVSGGGFGMALVGLKIFPIVILGGLDSIRGCLVGAIAIGVTEVWLPAISIRSSAPASAMSARTSSSSWRSPIERKCNGHTTDGDRTPRERL